MKRKTAAEKRAQKERLKEIIMETQDSVLLEMDALSKFLKFAAKFHKYSYNNILLIYSQCPAATAVASFGRWKKLGRNVKKGERGIAIFSPVLKPAKDERVKEDDEKTDADQDKGPDNSPKTHLGHTGYMVQYVYDLSQTEGEPVPGLESVREDPLYETDRDLFDAMEKSCPGLHFGPSSDMLLQVSDRYFGDVCGIHTDTESMMAAYILSGYLQMDFPQKMSDAVFRWAKEMDAKDLCDHMRRIQKVSKTMISALEKEAV